MKSAFPTYQIIFGTGITKVSYISSTVVINAGPKDKGSKLRLRTCNDDKIYLNINLINRLMNEKPQISGWMDRFDGQKE